MVPHERAVFRKISTFLCRKQLMHILRLLQRQRRQVASDNGTHYFNPAPFLIRQRRPVRRHELINMPSHFENIPRSAVRDRLVREGSLRPEASRISSSHFTSFEVTIVPKICAMAA